MVVAVTHPDVTSRNPRSLSEGGRQQALLAARRIRELLGKRTSLAAVVSSPRARCLETAIVVARELGETTREDGTYQGHIHVVEELDESETGPRVRADLDAVLSPFAKEDSGQNKAVLISTHGDLANMLGGTCEFIDGMVSEGWFEARPVIAGFEYVSGQVARVSFCEVFRGGSWVSCVQRV
jgi:Histidine phosphatase superfamily (branch 1)